MGMQNLMVLIKVRNLSHEGLLSGPLPLDNYRQRRGPVHRLGYTSKVVILCVATFGFMNVITTS